jgi:hypothetical protein
MTMTPTAEELQAALMLMNEKLGRRIADAEQALLYHSFDFGAAAKAYFRKYPIRVADE